MEKKWTIELTEKQLRIIADCVEDCHRFASGQCELQNTIASLDNCHDVRHILEEQVEPLIAPNGRGSSYSWNGGSCKNKHQRKFIAMTYGINHEKIHTAQMKELLYIPFYIIYLLEWIVRLFMPGNAYRNISFEREAYQNQYNPYYLGNRKHFAQWRTHTWNKQ